jgi:hypothetical protein
MTNCDETREHLESCEDCRLHITVEARLRTQPVLEPPKNLLARVMRALPRAGPVRKEYARLATAAAILIGLLVGAVMLGIDQTPVYAEVKPKIQETWEAVQSAARTFSDDLLRSEK